MKFISYQKDNIKAIGVLLKDEQKIVNLKELSLSRNFLNIIELINTLTEEDLDKIEKTSYLLTHPKAISIKEVRMCAPIEKPIHDLICVGVNYHDHLQETQESFDKNFEKPQHSVYFSKRVVRAIGPQDEIDGHLQIDSCLDYEVELGVIIGKTGINIPKEKAEDYIFGYTIINDISARSLQKQHVQWYRGKSLDTFTAMGPVILHKKDLPFPIEVNLCSRVNGEIRQSSNTKYFIADIPTLISDLSNGMTLEAGDIIATGTPAGVGMGFHPPRYMKSGDIIECEVEKIGILKNRVK